MWMPATEAMRLLPNNERCNAALGPVAIAYSTIIETKEDGDVEVFLDAPAMCDEDVRQVLDVSRSVIGVRYRDSGLQ